MEGLVCLHGYGVRGRFWDVFAQEAPEDIAVVCPSFTHTSLAQGVIDVRSFIRQEVRARGTPVHVLGHSLGGVMAALAGLELGRDELASLTIYASPWGNSGAGDKLNPLIRLLLARGLVPGFLIRPRFFGAGIPAASQKRLFGEAVREVAELREAITARPWFHVRELGGAYPHPVQGIGSESDRIVPARQTREFAAALGGSFQSIPAAEKLGHDDVAVSPAAAKRLWALVAPFIRQRG